MAPASSAVSTSRTIAASSLADAGRASAPDDCPADRAVTDEERDVGSKRLVLDVIEVLREGRPACLQRVGAQREVDDLAPGVGHRSEALPAIPRQLGGEPLVKVAGQGPIDEHRTVGMAMRIDEPRRDHVARSRRARGRRQPRRPRRDPRSRRSGRRARQRPPAGVAIRCRR